MYLSRPNGVWRAGLAVAGVAAVVNLIVFAVAKAAGVTFVVSFPGEPPQDVNAFTVVLVTVIGVSLGTALTALAVRRLQRGLLVARITAAVLTVASLVIPISVEASTSTKVSLATMHVLGGAIFVFGMGFVRDGSEAPKEVAYER
jgi:hypothetical protein